MNSKKKVLLIHDYTGLHGGGVVHLNLDLAKFLGKNNYEVDLFIPQCCFLCEKNKPSFVSFLPSKDSIILRETVRKSDILLVSVSSKFREIAQQSISFARKYDKPYIVWFHTRFYSNEEYINKKIFIELKKVFDDDLCRSFICVSRSVAEDIQSIFGRSPKVKIVYPGVYIPEKFENNFGTGNIISTSSILFAGRLSEEKGPDIFIRSFADLIKKEPGLKAVIIGDGPEKNYLIKLAKELNLTDCIQFLPTCSRSELIEHIKKCRIFCLSSRAESFSITLVEALALGATVVAPDTGGPLEILEHGKYGYLFKTGSAKSLTKVLKKAILEPSSEKLFQKLYAIKRFDAQQQFYQMLDNVSVN